MTFINDMILKDGAIFIADSHFKKGDGRLLKFISKIPKGRQIVLMGDIFHLLIGSVESSVKENIELINLFKKLSKTNEIIYVEGNHDFGLDYVFKDSIESNLKNIRIFPYKSQPIILKNKKNEVCILAHGDIWISPFYDFYRSFVSSKVMLFLFRILDKLSFGRLYKRFAKRINKREIKEFSYFRSDFDNFLKNRISIYRQHIIDSKNFIESNFCIIEGHFHLGKSLTINHISYNALSSQYFDKRYFMLKNDNIILDSKL